jgi:hypothetical protein
VAINAGDPLVLMLEGKRQPYRGELLTLGRQSIVATREQVERQAAALAFPVDRRRLGTGTEALSDDAFFTALGFDSVSSLDANAYENATFIHDLNSADIPVALENRFDVVFDRGTSEHVFHLPNLLASLGRLVKPGGRIIHHSPSSNHIDHGFYMFSPTLFMDYYRANGFEIPTFWLVAQPWMRSRPRVDVFEYRPGCLERIAHGGLDSRLYQIFCVAVRGDGPVGPVNAVVPEQRRYTAAWSASDSSPRPPPAEAAWHRLLRPIVRGVRRSVIGDEVWSGVVNPLKRRWYLRKSLRRVYQHRV